MAARSKPPDLRCEASEANGSRSRRARLALLAGFSALLALMILAGVDAVRVLRALHAEEENVRQLFLSRQHSLTLIRSSVRIYSDRVERLLRREDSKTNGQTARDLAAILPEVESAVKSYPRQSPAEELALLHTLEQLLSEHRGMAETALSWGPEKLEARARRFLNDELLPRRLRLAETTEEISILIGQQLGEADKKLQARYDNLDQRLTRLLFVALGAGLVLSLASAVYVLRLEREAQRRYRELAQSRLELQRLSARLVDAQEAERRSISRELHDEISQSLGAVLVDLGRVSTRLPPEEVQAKEQLEHIKGVVESTVQSARNIALLLRPSMLDDLGLVAALEWQAREVSRRSEMEVEVQSEAISEGLPDEYKTCIYRLVQEALNNAARHSSARSARVTVGETERRIVVVVRDDGRGFDPGKTRGMGILGMQERVSRLGGTLKIDSRPGHGTVLTVELPLAFGEH